MKDVSAGRRWPSVWSLAFGNAIDNADGKLLNFIFPAVRASLHLNLEALGLLTAVGLLSRMLMGPLWALAGDRWNRKGLLVLVTAGWSVWTILAGMAQNELQFLVLLSIAALGTVATEPLTSSLVADLFPEADRGRAFGVLRGVGGLILLVFVPVGIAFTHFADGWRWALFTVGGLSLLSGLAILVFVQEPPRGVTEVAKIPNERLHRGDLRFLLATPSLWLMALSMTLVTSLVIVSFVLTFLTDVRSFRLDLAQLVLAGFGLAFAVSSLIGGRMGDWAHRRWSHRGRIVLMQVYLVTYAAFSFLCLQIAWPAWAYVPLFLLFGLVAGLGLPGAVMPLVSSIVLPETRSTAFGLIFSLVQGGVLALLSWLYPVVAAAIGQAATMFWMTTVPYLVNAVLWFAFYRTIPRDHDRVVSWLKSREVLVPPLLKS